MAADEIDAGLPRYSDSTICMDTLVAIETVGAKRDDALVARVRRALGWFEEVEARCSRFDAASELSRLCMRPGEAVVASPMLFHVIDVAVAVAKASGGAFDPTTGGAAYRAGFTHNYRGGAAPDVPHDPRASFRDIGLNRRTRTVTLRRPLLLDLGGVAKGFAIDLAAAELASPGNFAINAGGDIFVAGHNAERTPWRIGIRDPFDVESLIGAIEVSGTAVCTSGGYERPRAAGEGHHLLDPQSGISPPGTASVTTIAPTAAIADAMSTAAFVLGPERGEQMLRENGVEGLIVTSDRRVSRTPGFPEFAA